MQSLTKLTGAALAVMAAALNAQPTITTIAGTDPLFDGEGRRADDVTLGTIRGVAIQRNGAVVFTDADFGLVLRLGPNNILEVVAGSGVRGFSGDSGPARAARLGRVAGVAVDGDGNIYFADNEEIRPRGTFLSLIGRVRKVSPDGIISTIAGGGTNFQDEDIPAVEASLAQVSGVAVDGSGNVYVTESGRPRVRRISREGRIRTFAGTGRPVQGFPPSDVGDGGPATASTLVSPIEVRIDRDGGVLIVDLFGDRVRRVAADGTIRTVLGGGRPGPPPLTAANVDITRPTGVAAAPDGSIYVMTLFGIMKVAPDQRVTPVTGSSDPPNNGGPVAGAGFKSDYGLNAMVSDSEGNIYIADSGHFQLRRIGTDGIVHAFAGSGLFRQAGENWPAALASFNSPTRLTVGAQGQIYFLERDNCKIREIQANGLVRTVAGNGSCWTGGGPNTPAERPAATEEGFGALSSMAADANGNVYVHDGIRVVRVAPDGRLFAVVNREARPLPSAEDGIPAINASLDGYTGGIALDRAGNLYIADTGRHRIRKVTADGIISTVAGSGPLMGPGGFAGDGGPAAEALLDRPTDVAVDRLDNLFILDGGNGRIRKVSPDGIITTIVNLCAPADFWAQMAVDAAGNIFLSDMRNHRVRRISPDGSLTTAAGTGEAGFSGDGGRPEAARLTEPTGVAVDANGNLYIGDTGNHRLRRVSVR